MSLNNSQLHAVILLAGKSTRLYPHTSKIPKSLLTIGDKPLLWYSINNLLKNNVQQFCFVVGFESQQIITFVKNYFPTINSTFIYNDKFGSTNSIYSYYLAIPFITHTNFFRLEGDLMYSENILKLLLTSTHAPVSAVEIRAKKHTEEYSVRLKDGKYIVAFGKDLPYHFSHGEAKGIEYVTAEKSIDIAKSLTHLIDTNRSNVYAEVAYSHYIESGNSMFYSQLGKDAFWCEIDTIEDLEFARKHIKKI